MCFHRVGKNYTKAHLDFNDPLSATLVQYYVKPVQLIGSLHLKQQIMRESISLSWLTGSLPLLWKEKSTYVVFGFPLTSSPSGEHLKRSQRQIPQFRKIILALLINRKLAA